MGKLKTGVASLLDASPSLLTEWHPVKNAPTAPSDVASRSTTKYWWRCHKGHEWEASASNRSKRGDGCPYCSGRYPIVGETDLATTMPALAETWHPTLNGNLHPTDVSKGSGKKVWWLCKRGHAFECKISSRSGGVGCGDCYRGGFPEGYTRSPKFLSNDSRIVESLDFNLNLGLDASSVEIDSVEPLFWRCEKGHSYKASPALRFKQGKYSPCLICNPRNILPGVNDLSTLYPKLALEFDHTKNLHKGILEIKLGDKDRFWWLCNRGHSYESRLSSRIHQGSGCPICTNQRVQTGFNDMATTHPELAKEFDLNKNSPLQPTLIVAGVRRKLWWICSSGHSFEAAGYQRITGTGCPICVNKEVLAGFNDMETTHPKLAREFDFEKNSPFDSKTLIAGTHKKLWWICPEGHSYEVSGMKRVSENAGCPFCSSKRVLKGFNDMATLAPQLLPHFHFEKNAPLVPEQLAYRTNKTLWWICERGHEYRAKPGNRLQEGGLGCPVCSGHKVLAGFNDLATTRPDLLSSWHPSKNKVLTPETVLAGTNKRAWWICPEGHEWFTYISLRSRGTNCPRCSKGGFDSSKPGWLYFIASKELGARKIGISNFEFKRLSDYEDNWSLVRLWSSESGLKIVNVETLTLRWLRKEKKLPPYLGKEEMGKAGGFSETFSIEGVSDFEVIHFIESLMSMDDSLDV